MSTFDGRLKEEGMEHLIIDHFERPNHDGLFFFLSHFHTDHFRGLFTEEFINVLVNTADKKLFCSELTKTLILSKGYLDGFKIPADVIEVLPVNSPKVLSYGQYCTVVTAIPAGHCPGSVMFLFEHRRNLTLYTGDFRIDAKDIAKISALHHANGELKYLANLYLDTTFCSEKYLTFPSRDESVRQIIAIIRKWTEQKFNNEIGIWYNSYHGAEFLLYEIYKHFKIQIQIIDRSSQKNFALIPEICCAVTKDHSRIHLCPPSYCCYKCKNKSSDIKRIKPCALYFQTDRLESSGIERPGDDYVRVCYSQHSSLSELIDVVKYLQPKNIYPCVISKDLTEQQVIAKLFKNPMEMKRKISKLIDPPNPISQEVSLDFVGIQNDEPEIHPEEDYDNCEIFRIRYESHNSPPL